jgi:ADP-L-glycero-D-manno-heptose 6-epimerase
MVNKQYKNVIDNGKIKLFKSALSEYKDGEQMRDFIYVKDAVEMTVFFDNSNPVGYNKNGIYNIGSGVASTWNRLANAIFKALNREPVIEYIEMPDNLKNQYQYYSKATLTKIRNAGYTRPIAELEDTVKDYVQNYLVQDTYLRV